MYRKKLIVTSASFALGTALATGLATGQASACSPDEQGRANDSHASAVASWDNDMHIQNVHMHLNAALREHASVGVEALKAAYLKTPDAPALMDAVEMNSTDVADTVESLYPGTHDEFLELWQAHIGYYQDYLHATVAGDENGREQAKDNLTTFAEDVSDLLGETNDTLDTDALTEAFEVHADQVLSIIDDFVAGDYDQAYMTAHEAYEHMGHTANIVTMGARGHHDYMMSM